MQSEFGAGSLRKDLEPAKDDFLLAVARFWQPTTVSWGNARSG